MLSWQFTHWDFPITHQTVMTSHGVKDLLLMGWVYSSLLCLNSPLFSSFESMVEYIHSLSQWASSSWRIFSTNVNSNFLDWIHTSLLHAISRSKQSNVWYFLRCRFTNIPGEAQGFTYSYNPCTPVDVNEYCINVAVKYCNPFNVVI